MTRNPARVPPLSRPAPPTRSWYVTAGAAALAAFMLLAWHANSLFIAAGLLAAGAAATALAEARVRSRRGGSTGIAPTIAAALIIATPLLVLLGIISYVTR
jgi:hypothetical protein